MWSALCHLKHKRHGQERDNVRAELLNYRYVLCMSSIYSVGSQPKFQSLISLEVGYQEGHKVVRVGKPTAGNTVVIPWKSLIGCIKLV